MKWIETGRNQRKSQMNLKQWAFEQSRRQWQRHAGTLAMLRGEAERTRSEAQRPSRRVIERGPKTIHL